MPKVEKLSVRLIAFRSHPSASVGKNGQSFLRRAAPWYRGVNGLPDAVEVGLPLRRLWFDKLKGV